MPQLQLLDLKQNYTLSQATLSAGPLSTAHTSLSVLVLSCTSVPFSDVVTVLQMLPKYVSNVSLLLLKGPSL